MQKSDRQLLKQGLISRYVYLFWWIDPKTEASNLQQFVKRNGLMFKEQPIKLEEWIFDQFVNTSCASNVSVLEYNQH